MILELDGLKNAQTDAFLNSASVTVTLVTQDGVQVSGSSWPVTMSYVATSDGKYQGILSDDLVIVEDEVYIAEITVDGGANLKGFWKFPVVAKPRKFV